MLAACEYSDDPDNDDPDNTVTWTDFFAAFGASVVILLVPGWLILTAARVAPWWRVVFAPGVSAGVIAALAVVFQKVGVRYEPLTVGGAVLALALVVGVAARFLPLPVADPTPRRNWIALAGGLVATLGLFWWEFVHQIGGPGSYMKHYDVPWHLAVIKRMVELGDGSTLTAGSVDHSVATFYPAGWHDTVALAVQATHAGVTTAVNANVYAGIALAWPLAMVGFCTVLFGRTARVIAASAVLSAGFAAFPIRLVAYGVVYANYFGYLLLPGLLAAAVLLFCRRGEALSGWHRIAILGTVALGVAIAQPNAIFSAWALLMAYVLVLVHRAATGPGLLRRLRGLAAVAAVVALAGAAWHYLTYSSFIRPTAEVDWPALAHLRDLAVSVTAQGFGGHRLEIALGVLVGIGAVVLLITRQHRWLLVSYIVVSGLYVVTAGSWFAHHLSGVRYQLTGFWYHDAVRLWSLIPMVAIPLATAGLVGLATLLTRPLRGRGTTPLVAAAAVVIVAATTQTAAFQLLGGLLHRGTTLDADPGHYIVDSAKQDFMADVAALVPSGTKVANNPYDGSAFAYPLFGTDVFYKSFQTSWGTPSADQDLLRMHLDTLSAPVCDLVRRDRIGFALTMPDVGTNLPVKGQFAMINYPVSKWGGLMITTHTKGFEAVLHRGDMTLWKITGCA